MPLNASAIYPATEPKFVQFASRRSVVHSTEGIVACTQPLAARCGLKVLQQGGNAAVSVLHICDRALGLTYIRMLQSQLQLDST